MKELLKNSNCGNPPNLYYLHSEEGLSTEEELLETGEYKGIFSMVANRASALKYLKDTFHLPDMEHIYLYRLNKVKQAISYLKSLRSGHFTSRHDLLKKAEFGEYSSSDIKKIINDFCVADAGWQEYFEKNRIAPFLVTYESLCRNRIPTLCSILEYLQVDGPYSDICEEYLPKRQYDETSEDWYQRYLKELL